MSSSHALRIYFIVLVWLFQYCTQGSFRGRVSSIPVTNIIWDALNMIWEKKNDLLSLVSLYKEAIFRAGSLLTGQKITRLLICRVRIPTCKKSATWLPKPVKKTWRNFLSQFLAQLAKTFAFIVTVQSCENETTTSVERSGPTFLLRDSDLGHAPAERA